MEVNEIAETSMLQVLQGNYFQKTHACSTSADNRRSKHMLGHDFIYKKTYSVENPKMSKERPVHSFLLLTGKLLESEYGPA